MLNEILYGYTFQIILKNSAVLGITAGMLGVFMITKKNSLLAGTTSNAALIGILLSVAVTGLKTGSVMMASAGALCVVSSLTAKFIADITKISRFMVHSLLASVNFGVCMVLFAYLSQERDALIAGLDKFIFGEAATLFKSEIDTALYVCAGSVLIIIFGLRRFKAILFNPELARTTRIPVNLYKLTIFLMTAAVTVVGIQTVGVLLMGALFITPAAAARLWTGSFVSVVFIAGIIGGLSGTAGGAISGSVPNVSTGPAVIAFAGLLFLISVLCAPWKGILWKKRGKYSYTPVGGGTK